MSPLTEPQSRLLQHLRAEAKAGRSPMLREIIAALGITTGKSSMHKMLLRLQGLGFLRLLSGRHGAREVLGEGGEWIRVERLLFRPDAITGATSAMFCACGAQLGAYSKTGKCHPCAIRAKSSYQTAAPDGFAADAAEMTSRQLMEKYGVSGATLHRWRGQLGLSAPSWRQPVPDGFRDLAPTMTMAALVAHFGRAERTVRRWCNEVGVMPARAVRVYTPRPARETSGWKHPVAISNVRRDYTQAGQAADFLRKFGPVVRCNPGGGYHPDGKHWRRGSSILTADEIIDRATRNGWNPDAWRQVA